VSRDTKITDLPPKWRYPAEWEAHAATWLAWPFHRELWEENLPAAQLEFVKLVEAISAGEKIKILGHNDDAILEARAHLAHIKTVEYFHVPYGDIWVRDTGCLFYLNESERKLCAKTFSFNGWGEKYLFPEDPLIAAQMASLAGVREPQRSEWIVEGGALEWDGKGNLLTTRQCLLNPNRKNSWRGDEGAVEDQIKRELGVSAVGWISEGLLNDHTDGHIDTIVRFVAPGVAVCMEAQNSSDPQRDQLRGILEDLKRIKLADGSRLEIFTVPSPGAVLDEEGEVMPASYMNFYLGNDLVVVPTYECRADDSALKALEPLFRGRQLTGTSSLAILSGGGSFHCITQQEPKL